MRAVLDLADNWLNLTRIELRVYTDNTPAIALYEIFGFEIEGTHRRMAFRHGKYVDGYSMARVVNRFSGSQHASPPLVSTLPAQVLPLFREPSAFSKNS